MQLASIFGRHMVLQRNKPCPIWGTGTDGEKIRVSLCGNSAQTEVKDGVWKVVLPPMPARDSEMLIIYCDGKKRQISDVAIGDVYIAGGQSNMEFHLRYEKHRDEEQEARENPRHRFFDVPEVSYDGQQDDFDYSRMGIWRVGYKKNLDYFSAVGYYFQKELAKKYGVPIGIIGCNWGGTRACAWMRPESVEKAGKPWLEEHEAKIAGRDMEQYWKEQHTNPMNNRGNPFADPFSEMVMPRTLSGEELEKLNEMMGDNADAYMNALMPEQFPGSLYEHMLKPLAPLAISGFLWYQGESDDEPGKDVLYRDMLTAMIGDWRALFEDENLPFFIVQLPGFESWLHVPAQNYPMIRKCQEEVANSVKNVHLCSISDVGEQFDIHPKDKKTVGHRLALLARGYVYREGILCDAPSPKVYERDGQTIRIFFQHAGGGIHVKGDEISALKVYGDGKELKYHYELDGSRLYLHLDEPADVPVKVSFARTNWYQVNLFNRSDIPAIPFEFEV